MNILDLPPDLLHAILAQLPAQDARNAKLTCRAMRDAVRALAHAAAGQAPAAALAPPAAPRRAPSRLFAAAMAAAGRRADPAVPPPPPPRPPPATVIFSFDDAAGGAAPPALWPPSVAWDDPWDENGARATLRALGARWGDDPRAWAAAVLSTRPGSAVFVRAAGRARCSHRCCSRSRWCLVDPMDNFAALLHSQRQFWPARATEAGARALRASPVPIDASNAHTLVDPQTGRKIVRNTLERIIIISQTGDLEGNRIARADPDEAAERGLTTVWGVGTATSEELVGVYRVQTVAQLVANVLQGARDATTGQFVVPAMPGWHPSARMLIGINNYDDLQLTIPRVDGFAVLGAVRKTAAAMWGLDPDRLTNADGAAYVCALGSTCRLFNEETGDVDVAVSPPPGAGFPATEAELDAALHRLVAAFPAENVDWRIEGVFGAPTSPERVVASAAAAFGRPPRFTAATWMGVVHAPGAPARRLDIKMYSREALPAGVAYMSGGAEWWHALKRHARVSRAARTNAAALGVGAEFFHLGDTGLVPMRRLPTGVEEPVGGPLPLTSEADIYAYLGLAYVPAPMRVFEARV